MLKYNIWHSAKDQCFTLLLEGSKAKEEILEKDAELIKTIQAEDEDKIVEKYYNIINKL
jgi:hypothetical protein